MGDQNVQYNILPSVEVSWPVRAGVVPPTAGCLQVWLETEVLREVAGAAGGTAVVTQVLSGLGGVGLELAASYVRERIAMGLDVLVWASASSRAGIVGAYAWAAIELSMPAGSGAGAGRVVTGLAASRSGNGRGWLFSMT